MYKRPFARLIVNGGGKPGSRLLFYAYDVRTQSEAARRDCADVWDKP